jgi:adenosine/AMP kinase
MAIKSVKIEKPEDVNLILGQTHFIKSAENLYEALVNSVPNIKFGLAFCEASQNCKVRVEGNDEELKELAAKNALRLSAGHSFVIMIRNAYPINVLRDIKHVPEVCNIFCATANEVDVLLAENERGRGILGVVDGEKTKGIETDDEVKERKEFLRKIGYKL